MTNTASARTGDLELTASCLPDPITNPGGRHTVEIENTGTDAYYVGEIQVRVLQGGMGSALILTRGGSQSHAISVTKLGTYASWGSGTWVWGVDRQPSAASSERIRTTVSFDRSAAIDPLIANPTVRLSCLCEVNVSVR